MKFKANCLATGIGSLPHTDPSLACDIILDYFPEIPYWPQLPKKSFRESMPQFFEDFPGLFAEKKDNKIYIDSKKFKAELESFYGRTADEFTINEEYAPGLYKLLEFKENLKEAKTVKGQIIGPISFGLSVTDENKRPVIYNDEMRDALIMNLQMKARYQEKLLKTLYPDPITFIDESMLDYLYTPYIGYDEVRAREDLEAILSGLEGLKGVHCCSKANWPFLLDLVNIISFDAYHYSDNFLSYSEAIKNFLKRGGVIAWGIIPTEEDAVSNETAMNLKEKLEGNLGYLAKVGINYDYLLENSLITPTCGLGGRSENIAIKAFELTRGLSSKMREKYNLIS